MAEGREGRWSEGWPRVWRDPTVTAPGQPLLSRAATSGTSGVDVVPLSEAEAKLHEVEVERDRLREAVGVALNVLGRRSPSCPHGDDLAGCLEALLAEGDAAREVLMAALSPSKNTQRVQRWS